MKVDADKLLTELDKWKRGNELLSEMFHTTYHKRVVHIIDRVINLVKKLDDEEKQRAENQANYKIDINLYDEMKLYPDCTVQVLHNTYTDEYSVGWWENNKGGA